MKDYKNWGIKRRSFPEYNYDAIWYNLKTIRLGEGQAKELPPEYSEFYDVSLGDKCSTGRCSFCYVSSNPDGKFYEDVCETWKKWMSQYNGVRKGNLTVTNKPFQIAIGSQGEATESPQFCKFLETVYNTNVVPNYTTNGVILGNYDNKNSRWYAQAHEILWYTQQFVGGVAVSYGNPLLRNLANKAIKLLITKGNTNVNIHHIISDKKSVDDFIMVQKEYGNDILYHVLLPLMPSGRSTRAVEDGVFEYMEEQIQKNNIENVAFGAHFYNQLKKSNIKTWLYEPESFSKNIILQKDKIIITPSSFDLNPVKVISL
jgi:hypothetical protein